MKRNGLSRIKASVKGKDSVMFGVQYLQGYKSMCIQTVKTSLWR